ncbi:hypothetical protein [Nocardia jiangxiensis]|uniref:hypothetical protein n=1 Tax=Nocardia jiangxiensis TaxID=282685 RepID=UPI0012F6C915|nr:hypothetical protein [Nocardia jiangxiensis]
MHRATRRISPLVRITVHALGVRMSAWLDGSPVRIGFLIVTGMVVTITCAGITLLRPLVLKVFGPEPGRNEQATMAPTDGVFHGLLLALVAAAFCQAYDAAQDPVAGDAVAVGLPYREVSADPEPERAVLRRPRGETGREPLVPMSGCRNQVSEAGFSVSAPQRPLEFRAGSRRSPVSVERGLRAGAKTQLSSRWTDRQMKGAVVERRAPCTRVRAGS